MTTFSTKQSGSTLIGFISGLVIGLGIAVVVAIMITKTPVPFLNKNAKGDTVRPPETAASANASMVSDPNKPLFGKQDAARAAAKEFAKEGPPDTAQAAQPADKAPTKAEGDANKATPAIIPAKADVKDAPAAADDKYVYYLQAGAFREQADAEGAKAKLALQGFEASISEKSAGDGTQGGTLYRVRLGPYSQLDSMNRVRSKLAESGMDVAVVRLAK